MCPNCKTSFVSLEVSSLFSQFCLKSLSEKIRQKSSPKWPSSNTFTAIVLFFGVGEKGDFAHQHQELAPTVRQGGGSNLVWSCFLTSRAEQFAIDCKVNLIKQCYSVTEVCQGSLGPTNKENPRHTNKEPNS